MAFLAIFEIMHGMQNIFLLSYLVSCLSCMLSNSLRYLKMA